MIILLVIFTLILSFSIQSYFPIITIGDYGQSYFEFFICGFIQWIIIFIICAIPFFDYIDGKEAKTINTSKNNSQITCEYYNNGKCVAGGYTNQTCSFNNPKNYVECPVYRYNALGDVSALY